MKKIVLANQVKPVRAVLTATLDPYFDYPDAGAAYDADDDDLEIGPLRYQLVIWLGTGAEETEDNKIDLNDLIINIVDWRTLDQHPLSATGDFVNGMIYLFGAASFVEIGQIEFRERINSSFRADMTLLIDLDGQQVGLDLNDVPITFMGLSFYLELLPNERPNAEAARRFVSQFVPLDAYADTPTFDDDLVYFAPRF